MDEEASVRAARADPVKQARGEWGRRATLRDGTNVLLRQIRPEDRDRLVEGLRALSPASRYLRFHADVDQLTEQQLDYLTQVDHVDHEAVVALDLDNPDVPGVGVARYIREVSDPRVAEAAITVADQYQGRGAGTMLLGALCARARTNGVEVFRNYVLAENTAMLAVFDELGATRELESEHVWCVDLALPEDEEDLPDSPAGRAFMAAARSGLRLRCLVPPVWDYLPSRGVGRDALAAGIEGGLASLDAELDGWLHDRARRGARWPVGRTGGTAESGAAGDQRRDDGDEDRVDDAG
jgi:RimJ/RimL family protein N-acetyltransferase